VVADLLYQRFPQFDEGQKSKIKSALVARPALAAMAERLELGPAMRLGRGEEKTGGRRKQALLADTCEAVIAAVYLDGGLDPVQRLIAREVGAVLERVSRPGLLTAMTGDYKSALQEWLQTRGDDVPMYHVVSETGPDHRKRFDVEVRIGDRAIGRAEGHTKKEAEQRAARAALAALEGIE
jgi:ribonuclease-3